LTSPNPFFVLKNKIKKTDTKNKGKIIHEENSGIALTSIGFIKGKLS